MECIIFSLSVYLDEKRKIVDDKLRKVIEGLDEASGNLKRSMEYSIFSGGKRLRPILAIASSEASGGTVEDAIPAAIALELIHTYSLVHDDLPSMDDDDFRRGVPTNHRVFGEATAVLTGDALLTRAFWVLTEFSPSVKEPALLVRVIREIAEAAGEGGMLGGQMADIESERKEIDLPTLELIHIRKTGAMVLASIRSGAILAGAEGDRLNALSEYGKCLGLAFQISDDILDVIGDRETMGKDPGQDHIRGKATYPALLGLSESKKRAQDLVERAISYISIFDRKAEPLRAIAQYIIERQS